MVPVEQPTSDKVKKDFFKPTNLKQSQAGTLALQCDVGVFQVRYQCFGICRTHLVETTISLGYKIQFIGKSFTTANRSLTFWRPTGFGDFRKKTRLNARNFAREFIRSSVLYRSGKSLKRHGKSSSLHSKKFFAWGVRVFCEWRHKRKTFRPPWPTLPGPRHQTLGGSILLKFLLETRLQSESFDTLDDLLGFLVQKLWCKLVKIFD